MWSFFPLASPFTSIHGFFFPHFTLSSSLHCCFIFMQKPKRERINAETPRQWHHDGSSQVFPPGALTALRRCCRAINPGLPALLWPHGFSEGARLMSPLRRASPLCHGRASVLAKKLWSSPVPGCSGSPVQAQPSRPTGETQALRYILLLMKLLCLFYCLRE